MNDTTEDIKYHAEVMRAMHCIRQVLDEKNFEYSICINAMLGLIAALGKESTLSEEEYCANITQQLSAFMQHMSAVNRIVIN